MFAAYAIGVMSRPLRSDSQQLRLAAQSVDDLRYTVILAPFLLIKIEYCPLYRIRGHNVAYHDSRFLILIFGFIYTKAIKEYIANQLKSDQESDQLSMFDPRDPFMGSK